MATDEIKGEINAYSSTGCSFIHIDNPNMYEAVLTAKCNGIQVDEDVAKVGIKEAMFDSQKGIFLNEKSVKLKEMGVRASRTAHNPEVV